MKAEKAREETEYLEDLESWEESILKKANPNYKDPELFFERDQ